MKIYFSPYELIFKNSASGKRSGCLIKVDIPDIGIGYADLFPWAEFGDEPLKDQLNNARNGIFNQQFQRSLFYARLDTKARAKKKSLFEGHTVPRSHLLFMKSDFSDEDLAKIREQGYRSLKVKVGTDLEQDIQSLNTVKNWRGLSLRFDFNGKLTEESFLDFYDKLSPQARDAVEFVEDPVPFANDVWSSLNKKLPLALDRHSEKYVNGKLIQEGEDPGFDYLVIKPARQDPREVNPESPIKLVFMGYLDHPVGQSFAAFEAASWAGSSCDTGLVFHQTYETNEYSERFKIAEGHLVPDSGIGIGFGDLLEKENWEPLYEG